MNAFDIGIVDGVKTAGIIPSKKDSTAKKLVKGTAILGGLAAAAYGGKRLIDKVPVSKMFDYGLKMKIMNTIRNADGELIDNVTHST